MTVSRTFWQNVQQYIWLVGGIACLLLAFIFWVITDSKKLVEVEKAADSDAPVQIQPEKVATTPNLGALADEVRPLDLTTRTVASGEHEPEFRGTKFINENKKQWTLEIFRASDEDIIKNFLKNRSDRNKFIYFRLSGEQQAEQYVLVYGTFKRSDDAIQQLTQINLQLPESIKPQPQQFSTYASLVNDLGADEMKGGNNQLYEVRLRPAALPTIDESLLMAGSTNAAVNVQPKAPATNSATKTTIVRRDAQGNVVDVQQSNSNIDQPSKPAQTRSNDIQ
ncbi:signal peptide protein [Acinetobacter baumannii]|nr:signal peptide protein [Acinetobacter baumannii]